MIINNPLDKAIEVITNIYKPSVVDIEVLAILTLDMFNEVIESGEFETDNTSKYYNPTSKEIDEYSDEYYVDLPTFFDEWGMKEYDYEW